MKNECLSAVTAELDLSGLPYRVRNGGKHLRVEYGLSYERLQVVPVSSSDRRGWLNDRARIRRAIREYGMEAPS